MFAARINIMKKIIALLCSLIFTLSVTAQKNNTSVTGRVYDSTIKKGLAYATVSILNAKDSTLFSFTRADSSGNFKLNQLGKSGNFILSASYVGYIPVWKNVTLKEGTNIEMGVLSLTDLAHATDVTVTARRPPVEMKNDTLEFNTENFKTAPNAVVEDMLKRLPGVTVDKDGTVRVNGQVVRTITVNGREFFTGDPKMATKNLNADWVDKVQVYDKKSDQSQFTGFDDGQTQKAINLKLKKDKDNALFGRVTAGAGNDSRYEGQTNINKFKGDKQASLIAMGNNTNKQGFTINDIMNFTGELNRAMRGAAGGGSSVNIRFGAREDYGLPVTGQGQNQQGIAETWAGGINLNDLWNKKKTDFNGNIMLSDTRLFTKRISERQNNIPGFDLTTRDTSITQRNGQQQKLGFTIDHKIDSFQSIRFVPQLTFQQGSVYRLDTNYSFNKFGNVNNGYTRNNSTSTAINFTNSLLYRKRFKTKGRSFSASINFDYNNSKLSDNLSTNNSFFKPLRPDSLASQNQQSTRNAITRGIGTNLSYTEPVGKRSLLEFGAFYNINTGESDKETFDYNGLTKQYDKINTILTNSFTNQLYYGGASVGIRTNIKKWSYGFGTALQSAFLRSNNITQTSLVEQKFTDLLPNANLRYKLTNNTSVGLSYNTSTSQPNARQLQPVPDVTNPLNVYTGNPALKRTYSQNLNINFSSLNLYKGQTIFGFAGINRMDNAITSSDTVFANGSRRSTSVNLNGITMIFANVSSGFAVKSLKSRLEFGLGLNKSKTASMLKVFRANGSDTSGRNNITNTTLSPSFNWNFSIENKIDIFATSRLNFTHAAYSMQPEISNNFLQQVYGIEMNNYIPGGVVLNNNFSYTINSGRSDGFNQNIPFWNASVAKSFLKNKRAEFKFTVFDILNKNIGINRTANSNFIEDVQYNVLQRYFLLSFTFVLNKGGNTAGNRVMIRTLGN